MADSSYEILKKVILVMGDEGVGKTALVKLWVAPDSGLDNLTTIGMDQYFLSVSPYLFRIIDTAGQKRYQDSTLSRHYKIADAIFLVFSITNRNSFASLSQRLEAWRHELKPATPIYLVATKLDLSKQRQVSYEEAQDFATQNELIYVETSAKDKIGPVAIQKRLLAGFMPQDPVKKSDCTSSQRLNGLESDILQLKTKYPHLAEINEICSILELGCQHSLPQNYFEEQFPKLEKNISALYWRQNSIVNTVVNVIITVLLALSVIGFPIAYFCGLLKTNEEEKRHALMFFAKGEKQVAMVLTNKVLQERGTNLRI